MSAVPKFPTMLRKMWSGGEVQRWIDEHFPEYARAHAEQETAALRAALRELIACKELKDKAHALPGVPDGFGICNVLSNEALAMLAEYNRRKPLAWAAARAAMAADKPPAT